MPYFQFKVYNYSQWKMEKQLTVFTYGVHCSTPENQFPYTTLLIKGLLSTQIKKDLLSEIFPNYIKEFVGDF